MKRQFVKSHQFIKDNVGEGFHCGHDHPSLHLVLHCHDDFLQVNVHPLAIINRPDLSTLVRMRGSLDIGSSPSQEQISTLQMGNKLDQLSVVVSAIYI